MLENSNRWGMEPGGGCWGHKKGIWQRNRKRNQDGIAEATASKRREGSVALNMLKMELED